MAGKKTLSDLGALTNPEPEAPAVEAPAEAGRRRCRAGAEAPLRIPRLRKKPRRRPRRRSKKPRCASSSSTSMAALMRPAAARTPSRGSGSSRASGKIVINQREQEVYFARPTLRLVINQPFDVADRRGAV